MKHVITIEELMAQGVGCWTVKDDSVRGCHTVSASAIRVGDHVLIDNYFTEVVEEAVEPAPVSISWDNQKTGVPSFSTRPVVTCTNCAGCARECYARRMERFPAVKNAWQRNTDAVATPERWHEIAEAIAGACVLSRFFRWFVAGDIQSCEFFGFMCDVARQNRGTKFLTFTKNYGAVNAFIDAGGKIPRNLVVIFSGWRGMSPENPHSLPESNIYDGDDDAPKFNARNFHCPGNCRDCNAVGVGCWQLKRGQKVWFKKH